ncbi:MAG: outer membrane beta-barrel protein [Woeseiaceae bacterium]
MSRFSANSVAALLLLAVSSGAWAQEVRYSWFEIAFAQQDIDRNGSLTDSLIGQTVDVSASDGSGIRFRGSVGTWNNMFAFVDYSSSDIDVDALVSNAQGQFAAADEFDFSTVRGGVGLKWSLTPTTDVYGAVSYDSTDFDFGSFAGENFDVDDQDVGATVGIRSIFADKVELRARVRYSGVADVDLSTGEMDTDTLFGVGFGYELIRGLSITGDFESGEFSSFGIGFRLDLDED